MKDLAKTFLNETERLKIVQAVKEAEKKTAGEIVPMVVSTSGNYPLSPLVGALGFSIPPAMICARLAGPLFNIPMRDMWVFLGFEILLFAVSYLIVKNVLWLRRLFISRNEIQEEVRRAALEGFYHNGLHRTRDETGVLIYISIFERTVWVLGDRGINEKVGPETWREVVSIITEGIRNKRQCEAICRAVERTGEILHEHFPVKPDDRDELPNIISEK